MQKEQIVLAGGCFWCLEAVYQNVRGVLAIECGYSNGSVASPSYEMVKTGNTGHAEVVKLTFATNTITLRDILSIFFIIHDPTQLNRQGEDIGSQYRSAVYYVEPVQIPIIEELMGELIRRLNGQQVMTQVAPVANYFTAEDYHQQYFAKNPHNQYCQLVATPKIEKFSQIFKQYYK